MVILVKGQVAFHHPLGTLHRLAVVRFGDTQAGGAAALYLVHPVIVQQPARQGGLVILEVEDLLCVPGERMGEGVLLQFPVLAFQVRDHLTADAYHLLAVHAGGCGRHALIHLLQQPVKIFFHINLVSCCL